MSLTALLLACVAPAQPDPVVPPSPDGPRSYNFGYPIDLTLGTDSKLNEVKTALKEIADASGDSKMTLDEFSKALGGGNLSLAVDRFRDTKIFSGWGFDVFKGELVPIEEGQDVIAGLPKEQSAPTAEQSILSGIETYMSAWNTRASGDDLISRFAPDIGEPLADDLLILSEEIPEFQFKDLQDVLGQSKIADPLPTNYSQFSDDELDLYWSTRFDNSLNIVLDSESPDFDKKCNTYSNATKEILCGAPVYDGKDWEDMEHEDWVGFAHDVALYNILNEYDHVAKQSRAREPFEEE